MSAEDVTGRVEGSADGTGETVGAGDATVCVDTELVAHCARLMVVGRVAASAAPADTPAEETSDDGDDDSTERGVETAEDTSSANIWSL